MKARVATFSLKGIVDIWWWEDVKVRKIFRIYQYIINEHNNKLIQIRMQHTIHQAHKCGSSISKAKWNYTKLVVYLVWREVFKCLPL